MNKSETFQALRRANPRARSGFAQTVETAADAVRTQLGSTPLEFGGPSHRTRHSHPRRRLLGISAAGGHSRLRLRWPRYW
jgi:hypothetical protein